MKITMDLEMTFDSYQRNRPNHEQINDEKGDNTTTNMDNIISAFRDQQRHKNDRQIVTSKTKR